MADRKQLELARALLAGRVDRRDFSSKLARSAFPRRRRICSSAPRRWPARRKQSLLPPLVAEPCGDNCPFAGHTVTVLVNTGGGEKGSIEGPFHEVRAEFEAATGATLNIAAVPFEEHFPKLIEDMASGTGPVRHLDRRRVVAGRSGRRRLPAALRRLHRRHQRQVPGVGLRRRAAGSALAARVRRQEIHGR